MKTRTSLLILWLLATQIARATLTVTTTADSGPGSLRDALTLAKYGETINFELPAPARIVLTSGELVITNAVNIVGPGAANLALDGNAASRVFRIAPCQPGDIVRISSLTMMNGCETDANAPYAEASGGAIYNDGMELILTDCTFAGNRSRDFGGAIYTRGVYYGRFLRVNHCTFSDNEAINEGGAIYNDGQVEAAIVIIKDSVFDGNRAYYGSALCNAGYLGYANAQISASAFTHNIGAAVVNLASSGRATMTITDSLVSQNEGRGIDNEGWQGQAIVELQNVTVSSNSFGGLYNYCGTMSVNNCVISGNTALMGGGIYNFNGLMPGQGSVQVSEVNIVNSIVSSNFADVAGGGIYNSDYSDMGSANVIVVESVMSGNSAPSGGAIYNRPDYAGGKAFVSIVRSTLSGNSATNGGAIWNDGGSGYPTGGGAIVMVMSSTLHNNSAVEEGGAVFNFGLYGWSDVKLLQSTFSSNTAAVRGGALVNVGLPRGSESTARATIHNSTFSGNSAPSGGAIQNGGPFPGYPDAVGNGILDIGSTILNASTSGDNITNTAVGIYQVGIVRSRGFNLCSDAGVCLTNATDRVNTDPLLGPLQNNGGRNFTHALLCGSPAIDAGRSFVSLFTDPRGQGFLRKVDMTNVVDATGSDQTDIGAFEAQQPCNRPPVAKTRNVTVAADANCSAAALVDDGSFDPDGDSVTVSQRPAGPYPVGTNLVTLTVTDRNGESSVATAVVVVLDTVPPQIICPANITTEFTSARGATVHFTPAASDTCSAPQVTCVPPSGSTFPIGTTTVNVTATDASGNSVSCSFTVTVLGARQVLQNVLDDLNVLAGTARGRDRAELRQAIDNLNSALAPRLWTGELPAGRQQGKRVFNQNDQAARDLKTLLKSKASQVPDESLQNQINRINRVNLWLASTRSQWDPRAK